MPFTDIVENLSTIAIVFVVLFLAFGYLLARERFAAMLGGLLRIAGAVFAAPFGYLRRAAAGIADFGTTGNAAIADGRHYLLARLTLVLQALLLTVAVAALALGLVNAYQQLQGPAEIRAMAQMLGKDIETGKQDLARLGPELAGMESAWEQNRPALIEAYTQEREQRREAALAENTRLADSIARMDETTTGVFASIQSSHQMVDEGQRISWIEQVRDDVRRSLEMSMTPGEGAAALNRYNDNWFVAMASRLDMQFFTDDQIRAVVQPSYASVKARHEQLTAALPGQEQELANLTSQIKPDIAGFFLEAFLGMLGFLVLVWVIGLTIEWLSIAVHMASSIHKIEESLAKQGEREMV